MTLNHKKYRSIFILETLYKWDLKLKSFVTIFINIYNLIKHINNGLGKKKKKRITYCRIFFL